MLINNDGTREHTSAPYAHTRQRRMVEVTDYRLDGGETLTGKAPPPFVCLLFTEYQWGCCGVITFSGL